MDRTHLQARCSPASFAPLDRTQTIQEKMSDTKESDVNNYYQYFEENLGKSSN